mgnify:FL=1
MSNFKKIIKKIVPEFVLKMRKEFMLDQQRKKFHKGCKELLFKVDDILKENGIPYWLTYGTLLGAYREHNFIAHDYDLDVALDIRYLDKIKPLMLSNGLKLKFEVHFCSWESPHNVEYRFEYNNTYIDFDFYFVSEHSAYTYNPLLIKNIDYQEKNIILPVIVEKIDNPFEGLASFSFLGREFMVPSNTEEFIIANYGPNWRTPIKDFDYHSCASNITAMPSEKFPGFMVNY